MGLVTRPNGATAFTDSPATDPTVGALLDAEFDAIVAGMNALDNANIAATPKIAGSKVDLTSAGFLPTDGSVDMTGTLVQAFEGVFRTMRASGNGKIRDYRGSDGALWGVSYNTYWTGSAWAGRDVTDICAALKMESDGLHYYHAVSGSAASTPSFTEVFHVNASGVFLLNGSPAVDTTSIADGAITPAKMLDVTAGDYIIARSKDEVILTYTDTNFYKMKEGKVGSAGTYRIKYTAKDDGGITESQIHLNGTLVAGTNQVLTATYAEYSADITGVAVGNLLQVYAKTGSGYQAFVKEFKICVASPHIAGILNGY